MKLNKKDAAALAAKLDQPLPNGHAKIPDDKEARRRARNLAYEKFMLCCEKFDLPVPVAEYRFHPTREWRFDWLFCGWLALEIQGGNWKGGRHVRPGAMRDEYDKLNAAVELGYSVLFCFPEDVESNAAFALVKRVLESGEAGGA